MKTRRRASPRLAQYWIRDLERDLDRGRAVVGEEHAGEIAGKKLGERRSEIDGGLMGETSEHHMLESGGLPREGFVELGMGVAVRAGPPRRDEVEDLAPFRIVERGAACACDEQRLALGAVLGEGMPDMPPVAREDIAGERILRRRVGVALLSVGCGVHGMVRASFWRSSSGSIASKVARVTSGSQGISAITFTSP